MKLPAQKLVLSILNLAAMVACFEALIAILNLNEISIYFRTAFYVGLFYVVEVVLLYDLHLKKTEIWQRAKLRHESVTHALKRSFKIFFSACWERIEHLRQWKFVAMWLNYLVLPGLIYWATISIFYLNFGTPKIQQIFVVLSTVALFLNYWYLKEVFSRGREKVDRDVFVVLSMVKIYTSAIVFGSALAWVRYYCLPAHYLVLAVFCCTFLLIYQALFQHQLLDLKNITITLAISLLMSVVGFLVLVFWGYNYFTAAIFLAAAYNFMWAIFHYHLDQALSWSVFWEILVVSIIIASMVVSVTNFKAKILDDCKYSLTSV